jgi:hypothetical protein
MRQKEAVFPDLVRLAGYLPGYGRPRFWTHPRQPLRAPPTSVVSGGYVDDQDYAREWGPPASRQRLNKMSNAIATFPPDTGKPTAPKRSQTGKADLA